MDRFIRRIKQLFSDPKALLLFVLGRYGSFIPDKMYLQIKYSLLWGKRLDFKSPKTFNDKLNWLKVNYHEENLHQLADKYSVKKFVSDIIGEEYVVPCLGVWDSFEEIDFSKLPKQFVIKTTHDSSGAFIVREKDVMDVDKARKHCEESLKRSWFFPNREWVYKDVRRRIIADTFLDDHSHDASGISLNDYKFWCFNGVTRAMYITVKDKEIFENFYDKEFQPVSINHRFSRHIPEFDKPRGFEKMWELAGKLAAATKCPFVRVDFFNVDGKIYFGEFTFYDWAGLRPFVDDEQDLELGSWLKLPNMKK